MRKEAKRPLIWMLVGFLLIILMLGLGAFTYVLPESVGRVTAFPLVLLGCLGLVIVATSLSRLADLAEDSGRKP